MKDINDLIIDLPEYALDRAKNRVEQIVKGFIQKEIDIKIEYPPQEISADLAIPCFPFAKILRKSPIKIASDIAATINEEKDPLIEKAEVSSGYLNITFNKKEFLNEIFNDFKRCKENYGESLRASGKTMVIDYSSPNVAKPFSVGNIRSTIIGQSIYNLYHAIGFRTIGINHIGDWGTQFGKLIYAYQLWGNEEKVKENPIKELLKLYVRFHKEVKEEPKDASPKMEDEARNKFKKLEQKDPEITKLWKWFVEVSLKDFDKIYERLGVSFDYTLGESFYNDKTQEVLDISEKLTLARRDSDGVLLVDLDEFGIETPMLLQRSDGATLYATRELASLLFRIRNFNPDLLVYVVGGEQKLHFQQAFKVLELLGFTKTQGVHVDFGMVSLKEGKMSTREGRVIFFEDLLEEGYKRAQDLIQEKRSDLDCKERNKIAEIVGVGAVKFNDLSQNRIKNVVFDWDKMLSFDGDTAPYLQYSYARVKSILRKTQIKPEYIPQMLKEKEEYNLMVSLAKFPETIREAALTFSPHTLAQYLLDTARTFTAFYQKVPVLKAENEDTIKARLGLIKVYSYVIKKGLSLIGIEVLERM